MTRKKTLAKVSAAAAAMVLLASTAAMAGPPFHVTVNGISTPKATVALEGTGSAPIQLLTDYGVPIACTSSSFKDSSIERAALIDALETLGKIGIFTIPASVGNCHATALNLPVTMQASTGDWQILATVAPTTAGAPIDVGIWGMSFYVRSGSCEFEAKPRTGYNAHAVVQPGPIGGQDARLDFSPLTGVFPLELTAYNGAGTKTPSSTGTCGGQIYTGDRAQVIGSYDLDTSGLLAGPISSS